MIIAFNGIKCGWANNGGTQSLFRMAGALVDRGHKVMMWSNVGNAFTWFKPHSGIKFVKCGLKDAPYADAVISTSCKTIWDTFNHPAKKAGVCWLRAHETWTWSDKQLMQLYNLSMPVWANSEWMKQMIEQRLDRTAEVQYCGVPIDDFHRVEVQRPASLVIGALYSDKGRKKWKAVKALIAQLPYAHFIVFGTEKDKKDQRPNYYRQPSLEQKRELYSQCHFWFAPSDNEGLHIPPIEAALCGAVPVVNRVPAAGNMDWCVHNKTALVVDPDDAKAVAAAMNDCIEKEQLKAFNKAAVEIIRTKIGSVETNAERFEKRLQRCMEG